MGIGKFVGIKHVATGEGPSDRADYMFIEYSDGMAKLPVKQAGRLLYRYNLYVFFLLSFTKSISHIHPQNDQIIDVALESCKCHAKQLLIRCKKMPRLTLLPHLLFLYKSNGKNRNIFLTKETRRGGI